MGRSHYGEVCIRIRICGINCCKELHNGVLHRENFVGTNTEKAEKKKESPSTRKREQAKRNERSNTAKMHATKQPKC